MGTKLNFMAIVWQLEHLSSLSNDNQPIILYFTVPDMTLFHGRVVLLETLPVLVTNTRFLRINPVESPRNEF